MSEELDRWFKTEVLPHEAALVRYLTRVWRDREEIEDLRQEIYARIYEAASRNRPAVVRPFLFVTAKNLLADRVRRGRIVSIEAVGDFDALTVSIDELTPERRITSWQELKRVTRAFNRLPPRCREIVWFRKVDGLSTRKVAEKLQLSERTVEGQIAKGMRILTEAAFGGPAFRASATRSAAEDRTESEHGE